MIHVDFAGRFRAESLDKIETNMCATEAIAAQVIKATDKVDCLVPLNLTPPT